MKRRLRIIVILLATVLVTVSGYQLYGILSEYSAGETLYEKTAQRYLTSPLPARTAAQASPGALQKPLPEAESAPIAVDFEALLAANADVVGWLYCENTVINYPVVRADDNDFYMHRLLDGSENSAGTLFMDYRIEADFSERNNVIYGHNMKNGAMFGTLKEYGAQSFYEAHPVLWLLTPGKTYRVELLAGFVTASDSDAYDALPDAAALREHLIAAQQSSTFKASAESAGVSRILTLSTCSYEFDNARYVLIGSLIPVD